MEKHENDADYWREKEMTWGWGGVGGSLSLKHRGSNGLTQHASLRPMKSRITPWDSIFEPCSYIPTSLIPRRPPPHPPEPPRAIGAVILSGAVARFHPAANHFVSAQTELPDRRARTASVSRKRPSWKTSRLFSGICVWELRNSQSICMMGGGKKSVFSLDTINHHKGLILCLILMVCFLVLEQAELNSQA